MMDIGMTNLPKGILLKTSSNEMLIEDMDTKERVSLNCDSFMIEEFNKTDEVIIVTYDPVKKVLL